MKPVDIQILCNIIEEKLSSDKIKMLYKDAFAAGCYLYAAGYKSAGRKLCDQVLEALDWDEQKNYFNSIMDTLDGHEDAYAADILANKEISSLSINNPNGLVAKQ